MDPFINRYTRFCLFIGISVRKKHLTLFLQSGIALNYTFRHFFKINLLELGYVKEIGTIYINGLQTVSTKFVETLLGHLSICSILLASSINSLIPPAPQFNVVKALWSLQSKKWKNQHCFWGKGGKCDQDTPKSNFTTKCLNTFVAHCGSI